MAIDQLTITRPDDWHLHLRDGDALAAVAGASAAQFARAIVMPNLKPPVTTVEQARAYRERILAALPAGQRLRAADDAVPDRQHQRAGDSRGGGLGLRARREALPGGRHHQLGRRRDRHPSRARRALEAMQAEGVPLLVHGEVTDREVDVFDREKAFIDTVMIPLRRDFPALRVVFEHITTLQAAQYVRDADEGIGATITAHHLLYNRNAIFAGGLRPHWYCLPVLKREAHRRALLEAATGGNPRFFLGTDSAPHARRLKEHAAACAGCYTAPHALELYATAFDAAGALDALEGFASRHGPAFYRLPVNTGTVTLRREPWQVPESLPFPGDAIVPLAGGETLPWRLSERA